MASPLFADRFAPQNLEKKQIVDQFGEPYRNGSNGTATQKFANRFMGGPESGFAVPHVLTFASILGSAFRNYYHGQYDEATRFSREDALAMRNDAYIMALLNERKSAVATLKWHVEVDNPRDAYEKAMRDGLTRLYRAIPRMTDLNLSGLEALWFGRAGDQFDYGNDLQIVKVPAMPKTSAGGGLPTISVAANQDAMDSRRCLVMRNHMPVEGDKIDYDYDGNPYILITAMAANRLFDQGADVRVRERTGWRAFSDNDRDVVPKIKGEHADIGYTTIGGRALYLKGNWRTRFRIHKHQVVDSSFFEPWKAGAVHGVGIRSVIFWYWWLRQEFLSNVTDWCARTGLGVKLWYYESGNAQSEAAVDQAARDQTDRVNIKVPYTPGIDRPALEVVETSGTGADLLLRIVKHIEDYLERYIVGQSMSGGSDDTSAGFGDKGRADFAQNCVPLDSEILTRYGFKSYDMVEVGDEVLAYDVEADECKWTPLLAKSVFRDAPVIDMSTMAWSGNTLFSVTCTPDHSWAVESREYRAKSQSRGLLDAAKTRRRQRIDRVVEASRSGMTQRQIADHEGVTQAQVWHDLHSQVQVAVADEKPEPIIGRRGGLLNAVARRLIKANLIAQHDCIILAAPETAQTDSILTPVEAALLGWVVTDGHIRRGRTGNFKVRFYQSKEPYVSELRALTKPFDAYEWVGQPYERTFPNGKTYACRAFYQWCLPEAIGTALLKKCDYEGKHSLPRIVARLNGNARKAMLDAMMKAEWHLETFFNKNQHVMEAYEILCALEGHATGRTRDAKTCDAKTRKKTRYVTGQKLHRNDAGVADVWCPTTAYGTWVMRQRGQVTITGNTKYQITKLDAGKFGDTNTTDVLDVFKRWSYPEMADVPARLVYDVDDPDVGKWIEGAKAAVDFGVKLVADEVRSRLGLSAPREGDEVVGGMEALQAQQATSGHIKPPEGRAPGEEKPAAPAAAPSAEPQAKDHYAQYAQIVAELRSAANFERLRQEPVEPVHETREPVVINIHEREPVLPAVIATKPETLADITALYESRDEQRAVRAKVNIVLDRVLAEEAAAATLVVKEKYEQDQERLRVLAEEVVEQDRLARAADRERTVQLLEGIPAMIDRIEKSVPDKPDLERFAQSMPAPIIKVDVPKQDNSELKDLLKGLVAAIKESQPAPIDYKELAKAIRGEGRTVKIKGPGGKEFTAEVK